MAQSWFDQSPAGNLGIYGQGQPIIAPPVQEAPQIDIASAAREYAKKKRMAEALRGRAGSLDMSQRSPTIVSEGANGAPGEVQVNWGGIAENALMPWLKGRAEDKALGSDDEATAARVQALKSITGDSTPEQLLQAGESLDLPELSKRALTKILPEDMNAAARAQASATKAGLRALLQMGQISQEEYDAGVAAIDADAETKRQTSRDDFLWKEQNTYRAPVAGKAPSSFDLWRADNPDGTYTQFAEWEAGLKGKGGKSTPTGSNNTPSLDDQISHAEQMVDLVSNPNTWAAGNSIGQAAENLDKNTQMGGPMTSIFKTGAGALGQSLPNKEGLQLRRANIQNALDEAATLKPVSDNDMATLRSMGENALQDQKSATEFAQWKLMMLKKAKWARDQGLDAVPDGAIPLAGSNTSAPAQGGAWSVEVE